MAEVPTHALIYHFGDSFGGLTIVWADANEDPVDLTGYVASMKVRTDDADRTEVLSLTSPSGGLVITAPTEGAVLINATPAQMLDSDLEEGVTYVYDIQVESDDGSTIQTLLKGPFRVDAQVTDG